MIDSEHEMPFEDADTKRIVKKNRNQGKTPKPDITTVRRCSAVYIARASEFGNERNARADYMAPTDNVLEDFGQYRERIRATISHLMLICDAMDRHQAQDSELLDVEGMRMAANCPDDGDGGSRLPHIAHAIASLQIAITRATECGMLPKDPGQPWKV